jgi:hypothetical protein
VERVLKERSLGYRLLDLCVRLHTQASIECQRGDCQVGIHKMLVHMRHKAMVPPPEGVPFS